MEVRQILVDESKWNIKCPYSMTPEYITVHNTANDASAENEIKYMISNDNQVSFHYAVDDKEVVQGILTSRNTWHAGDGANGTGNRKSIAVEICYSKSGGDRFVKAEKKAAELIAELLHSWDLGLDRVKKHQDWNGKYCPHRTLDMGWDRFLKMVEQAYNGQEITPNDQTTTATTGEKVDQVLHVGSKVELRDIYKITSVSARLNAIACKELADQPFADYNYIDATPCVEVDKNGVATKDQVCDTGHYIKIPGVFTVLAIDKPTDACKIKIGSREVWVKCGPCTEV